MLGDAEQADLVVKEQILVSKNKTKLKIRQLIKKQSVFQKSQFRFYEKNCERLHFFVIFGGFFRLHACIIDCVLFD